MELEPAEESETAQIFLNEAACKFLSENWPEEDKESKTDNINHPAHYTDGGIETIDYIRAKLSEVEFIGYCKGNILKYVSRAGKKVDIEEDIRKAVKYAEWIIDRICTSKQKS